MYFLLQEFDSSVMASGDERLTRNISGVDAALGRTVLGLNNAADGKLLASVSERWAFRLFTLR